MAWYGWFSKFYDQSLERLYAPHRETLFNLVEGSPSSILDVACGTGQNFPFFIERRQPEAPIWGVDLSAGMLERARLRGTQGEGENSPWPNVHLLEEDIRTLGSRLDAGAQTGADEPPQTFDWVVCTLGLTVVPDWEAVFAAAWSSVAPGGHFFILDVWAKERVMQSWIVEKMAQADLSRCVFAPLEEASTDFQLLWLDAKPSTFGGKLFAAVGRKG